MAARRPTSTDGSVAPLTREKILRSAERLFAKEGFDRVTLRQIARDADQKNVAAVQYHFGSKAGLLAAIVDIHREEIEHARTRLLARSESDGRGGDLATLIDILVEPLAEKLDSPSGRAYLRIQAQGLTNESMRPTTRTVVQRISQNLGALKGEGDDSPDSHRPRFALLLLLHALADRAQQEEAGRARRADRPAFITSLGRSLEGLFLVPHE